MSLSSSDLTRGVFIAEEPRHADTSHPKATTVSHYIPLAVGCAYITPELFFFFYYYFVSREVSSVTKLEGNSEEAMDVQNLSSSFQIFVVVFYASVRATDIDLEQRR